MDTNMIPGNCSDPWNWHGLWWYQEPWTWTQTLTKVGPWTQTRPQVAARAQMSPCTLYGHSDLCILGCIMRGNIIRELSYLKYSKMILSGYIFWCLFRWYSMIGIMEEKCLSLVLVFCWLTSIPGELVGLFLWNSCASFHLMYLDFSITRWDWTVRNLLLP